MRKRISFVIVLTVILVSTFCVSVFSAVPSGKSGVNFAEIYDGQTYLGVKFPSPGENYYKPEQAEVGIWYSKPVNFYQSVGGTDTALFNEKYTLAPNTRVILTMFLDDLYADGSVLLFQNLNRDNLYYMACAGTFTNTTTNERHYLTSYAVDILNDSLTNSFFHTAGASDGFKMTDSLLPSNNELDIIYFVFENTSNSPIVFDAVQISGITLLQENYIREDTKIYETGEVLVTSQFVPFQAAYFSTTEAEKDQYNQGYNQGYRDGFWNGETEGYNNGYSEGATDAGGAPLQKWGAFLLTAVSGFMSFEIFPGFPLWGLLAAVVAVPLLMAFLKMFAGG